MRFFELITDQPKAVKNEPTVPGDQKQDSKTPDTADKPAYATSDQQKPLVAKISALLAKDFPLAKVQNRTDKVIPHIRILNALPSQEVFDKLVSAGIDLSSEIDNKQYRSSDSFQPTTYSYAENDTIFTIVISTKGQSGKAEIGVQMLRPENFGLTGKETTRRDLAELVKSKIPSITKDQMLQQALIQLVDVATKDRSNVDQTLMDHIKGQVLNYISQDFGEILTPLVMAKDDSQIIKFPEKSNKPLIDAEIGGKPVAVKSLTGSGNSFVVIKDLIDSYVETKRKEDPTFSPSKSFEILKDFVSEEGKTVDKLIRAAQKAKVPEAVELNKILGVSRPSMNYNELTQAVGRLVKKLQSEGTDNLYKRYLATITPAAFAAGRMTTPKEGRKSKKEFVPKPIGVGLPADYSKYMNIDSEDAAEENKRSAGKKKFDQDFVKAASRQLTYMLGVGFRNYVVEGPAAKEMADTITDIMTAKDAMAARIQILPNGTIDVQTIPFSEVKFGYQYHAGTSTVNQNAPGFHMIFP